MALALASTRIPLRQKDFEAFDLDGTFAVVSPGGRGHPCPAVIADLGMTRTIAIFGDVHGHQDAMVRAVLCWQEQNQASVDLILCVGDFQAMRGEIDMRAMACPAKYQQVGDYPAYHAGEKSFPVEVVFVGGNHEAYNWLETMSAGGYLGPNCYYLGRSGVIERLGLWIAGLPELAEPGTADGTPRRGVGNEPARWLLEQLKPPWAFCGHMHQYFRGQVTWAPGTVTRFVCLERVTSPASQSMCVLRVEDQVDGHPRLEEDDSPPQGTTSQG